MLKRIRPPKMRVSLPQRLGFFSIVVRAKIKSEVPRHANGSEYTFPEKVIYSGENNRRIDPHAACLEPARVRDL